MPVEQLRTHKKGGAAHRVGHVGALRLAEQGDGGVCLGGEDVHQRVAVPVQGHARAGLQQLPARQGVPQSAWWAVWSGAAAGTARVAMWAAAPACVSRRFQGLAAGCCRDGRPSCSCEQLAHPPRRARAKRDTHTAWQGPWQSAAPVEGGQDAHVVIGAGGAAHDACGGVHHLQELADHERHRPGTQLVRRVLLLWLEVWTPASAAQPCSAPPSCLLAARPPLSVAGCGAAASRAAMLGKITAAVSARVRPTSAPEGWRGRTGCA